MLLSKYMALVSRYRLPVMGVCIFAVVVIHCGIILPGGLGYFMLPLWAVDVFFFLSGMGAHRSLSKNNGASDFLRRRFNRIYIPYFPIVILYFAFIGTDVAARCGVPELLRMLLGNLTMLGWVCGMDCQFNWYPQAMALIYFITPVLFSLVKRLGAKPKRFIGLLALAVLAQVCFFETGWLIVSSRFMCFLMGMIASELVERGIDFKLNTPAVLVLWAAGHCITYRAMSLPDGIVWNYGVQWLPCILSVTGDVLILCAVFERIEKIEPLKFILSLNTLAGRYSYEIMLVHILAFMLIPELDMPCFTTPGAMNVISWLIASAAAVILAILYGKALTSVRKQKRQ